MLGFDPVRLHHYLAVSFSGDGKIEPPLEMLGFDPVRLHHPFCRNCKRDDAEIIAPQSAGDH